MAERLTIDVTGQLVEYLREEEARSGRPAGETVRRALALYAVAMIDLEVANQVLMTGLRVAGRELGQIRVDFYDAPTEEVVTQLHPKLDDARHFRAVSVDWPPHI